MYCWLLGLDCGRAIHSCRIERYGTADLDKDARYSENERVRRCQATDALGA